jgi:hypothetical protein
MRDVEAASQRLAGKYNDQKYQIMTGGLSDFETKGVTPGVHQLYSLAIIYRLEFNKILSWYGVDLNQTASDLESSAPPRTHFSQALPNTAEITKPIRIDQSFDPRTTSNFAPMVKQWGTVPLAYLQQLSKKDYSYGYIGSEDLTMDPILPPGSFVQVDESRNKVFEGDWRSEYYRPIYFVETGKVIPAAGAHSRVRNLFLCRIRSPLLGQKFCLPERPMCWGKLLESR